MNVVSKLPFYVKVSLILVGLYVFISILSITQSIILPFLYAGIIAVSISPGVNFLLRKGMNRPLAIAIVLTVAILVVVGFLLFLCSQASMLSEAWPELAKKFNGMLQQCVAWWSETFNTSEKKINAWIVTTRKDIMNLDGSAIGTTISTVGGVFATTFLTPVYIFMILFYQPHLIEFIHRLFGASNENKVSEILTETKGIIQSYLRGLFAEMAIIAVLNSVGLLILGIQYAILLGVIGAILNVIPYLGGIIAMALFAIVALITKSPEYVLYVIGLYTIIQLIDNNYIVPKIVGSKVQLNALISLLAVILGGALWGIPGMFLSIPMTAILKLIFDRVQSLKPWGFLLGDTMPRMVGLDISHISKKIHAAATRPKKVEEKK